MPAQSISVGNKYFTLDVRPDRLDLRDRIYLPPTLSLPPMHPLNADIKKVLPAYVETGLVLDQGTEGACTGFGLASVINYLLWRRTMNKKSPGFTGGVSPHMLYDLARYYDEWPGQDYDGSSCRGAMKGWHKHGACLNSLWERSVHPTASGLDSPPNSGKRSKLTARSKRGAKVTPATTAYRPDKRWALDAAQRPVGVYYRVDHRSVTDMQAAIYDIGAIYVSSNVHDGWQRVRNTKLNRSGSNASHSKLPRIDFNDDP